MNTTTTPKPHSWADRQAVAELACPCCHAEKDKPCIRPDGARYNRTHSERILAYRDKIGSDEFTRRHSTQIIMRRRFNPAFTMQ